MYIGKRVKELRTQQGLTLTTLAERSGVQMATLSRIEHLKMVGTLDTHLSIAKALNVDIIQLYANMTSKEDQQTLKSGHSSTDVFVHSDKSSYEILANQVLSKRMMPILLKVEPGGRTHQEEYPQGSERFCYVLQGTVTIKVGDEAFTLNRHHTLYFDASQPHSIINKGKQVAKIICVTTPVIL